MRASAAAGVDAIHRVWRNSWISLPSARGLCSPDRKQIETEMAFELRYPAFCAVPAAELGIVWNGAFCAGLITRQELWGN